MRVWVWTIAVYGWASAAAASPAAPVGLDR
jgi:hypothetical protein